MSILTELLADRYYAKLEGRILEAFGRPFKRNPRIHVYPLQGPANEEIRTVDNAGTPERPKNLFAHLVERGMIR